MAPCSVTSSLNQADKNELKISAYPNPAYSKITFQNISLPSQLKIYNSLGKVIWNKKITDEEYSIDVSAFEDGLYVVEFNYNEKAGKTLKFFVQH